MTCEVTSCGSKYYGNIVIPSSVTYGGKTYSVTAIGKNAFYYCSYLTSVVIPPPVTLIDKYAFSNCTSLKSVVIPNSVTSIKYEAFSACSSLTSVEIPNSVTSLEGFAFADCSSLKSVVIGNSVTSIGPWAFSNCSNLTSVEIGNSVTSIEDYAFQGCFSLTSVEFPNSVTSIGGSAFSGCRSLTSVKIPNSVTSIGGSAFSKCSHLTSVMISNPATSIGDYVFSGCSNLPVENNLRYAGTYLVEAVDKTLKTYTIKEKTKWIGSYAFQNCSRLTSVEIPNSVTSIGNYAFASCSNMTSVEIPNSVTSIRNYAFASCSNMTSVEIGNSVTSIGNSAFSGCSSLTSVDMPSSVTSIGNGAFEDCSDLTSVTVENTNPANIIMGRDVFYNVPTSTCALYVPNGCKELYATAWQWKDFVNIEELGAEELDTVISLADGERYAGNRDKNNIDITYTRTFSSTDWQPLYLPFNMSYDEWSEYGIVAELACVHTYEDGKTIIEFVTVNSGELLPNVPYVIKPNDTGEVTFNCTGKQLKAAPAEGEKFLVCCSPRYVFKLFGNYQTLSAGTLAGYGDAQFNGAYVMTAGNKFSHAAEGSQLKPYRFYITKEKNPNGYWSAPARYNMPAATGDDADVIYFMVDGKVTGILSASEDSANDVKVYDLNGIQTRDPHNGLFIKNGKKVYIK